VNRERGTAMTRTPAPVMLEGGLLTRWNRATAEHEAAHAVIGVLTGLVVGLVSVNPARNERARLCGYCQLHAPSDQHWPIPRTATAEIDTWAAGYAWEYLVSAWSLVYDAPDLAGYYDRCSWPQDVFAEAVDHVAGILADPRVRQGVEAVADALMARKSGRLWGRTVVTILTRLQILTDLPCTRCAGAKTVTLPATGQVCDCPTCHGRGRLPGLPQASDLEPAEAVGGRRSLAVVA
jgi:hypothetical protein